MIRIGIERKDLWLPLVKNRKTALCVNTSSYLDNGQRSLDVILANADVRYLLSLEHGLFGKGEAGESMENTTYQGIPVISLYREDGAIALPPALKAEVEIILFDVQDLGLRFYTYIASLKALLNEAGFLDIPVMVFDRLNPFGRRLSGNVLSSDDISFVGPDNLPIEYGMTIGELAQFFNARNKNNCSLTIIPIEGWRDCLFCDSGRVFYQTSPAIESFEAAFVYSGFCLFEALNVSEGRGTERPFRLIGAPYINPSHLLASLPDAVKKGFLIAEKDFIPEKSKYAGLICHGLDFSVEDYSSADPLRLALALIRSLFNLYPECEWVVNKDSGTPFMNRLLGSEVKKDILSGSYEEQWEKDREVFRQNTERFYLY